MLKRQKLRARRVRIAGKVNAIRHSDGAFTLIIQSGDEVHGILAEPEMLARYFGKIAIVSGIAQFRRSGALLRLDVDEIEPGDDADLALWSEPPQPLFPAIQRRELRRPQGRHSGLNAVIGAWPGDEPDAEIFALLEEIS